MAVKTWVWIVVGITSLMLILLLGFVGASVYIVTRHVDVEDVIPATANRDFDRERAKFKGQTPLIDLDRREQSAERLRTPAVETPRRIEAIHVLAWNPDDNKMVRATIPFWLARLSGKGRIDFGRDELDIDDINLTVEDLERHGPGLILDHRSSRGVRVLVWSQ